MFRVLHSTFSIITIFWVFWITNGFLLWNTLEEDEGESLSMFTLFCVGFLNTPALRFMSQSKLFNSVVMRGKDWSLMLYRFFIITLIYNYKKTTLKKRHISFHLGETWNIQWVYLLLDVVHQMENQHIQHTRATTFCISLHTKAWSDVVHLTGSTFSTRLRNFVDLLSLYRSVAMCSWIS